MREPQDAIRQRYQAALDRFIDKLRQDSYIIAAILCGSLAHDSVWEKSDIDIVLIGRDEKRPFRTYYLVEDGINIHALMYSRSRFKQVLEHSLQSDFFNSYIAKSKLLFSLDPSIADYYAGIGQLGAADRERALLRGFAEVLPLLVKTEKWLYVKHDPAYSWMWLMYMVGGLARIEVALNSEVAGREVLQQAMRYNPQFFTEIYFDLLDQPKQASTIGAALTRINAYLDGHVFTICRPLLDYLAEAGGPRSATEIDSYFGKRLQAETIGVLCEWLATRGLIQQIATPLRLTEKSRITVDEAAYFYADPA